MVFVVVAETEYGSWIQDFEPPADCGNLSICTPTSTCLLWMLTSLTDEEEIRQRVAAKIPADALKRVAVEPKLFGARLGYVGPVTACMIWY